MKTPITLLALSMSAGLVADNCCQPCCVPNPRAPICIEAYTPAFDDMQCDWDVFIDAEFLYWYAGERDLVYAVEEQTDIRAVSSTGTTADVIAAPVSYNHFNTKWAPGFRLGFGGKFCDGWDLSLYWTWYKNNKKNSTSVDAFSATQAFPTTVGAYSLMNPFVPQDLFFTAFDRISAKWQFRMNQIDLEMGRKYFLSECFVMRTYAGLRGAWSKTNLNITSSNSNGVDPSTAPFIVANPYKDSMTNKIWGVGLLGGIQPSWYFTDEFSLFGNLEAALLWGKFQQKHNRNYVGSVRSATAPAGFIFNPINYSNSASANYSGMQPVIDLALGFRWETNWCENRYAFALDAAWEHHIWFNYNNRTYDSGIASFSGQTSPVVTPALVTSTAFSEQSNDVYFGGFVLRARFDF